MVAGVAIFTLAFFNYLHIKRLSFSRSPQLTDAFTVNSDIPVEIIIPSVNLDVRIEPGVINDNIWQISNENAMFMAISSPPGSGGNTVVYGHNKRRVFGSLPYVGVGQKITLKTASGKIYNYVVDKKYFVEPSRVDLISPTDEAKLTLYTCWGLFDSQRAVIVAKPQI